MASLGELPELVRDSRLPAAVRDTETIHTRPSARRNISRNERWLMKNLIGHGGGGVVWLQRRVEGNGPVELRAVKSIRTGADIDTVFKNKRFVRELEASAKFSQEKYADHFVKSYGWYDSPGWLYITMEYCPHGDLGSYLSSNTLLEDQVQEIATQLLEGLILMHAEGFAHRDLKPSNILIVTKPPEEGWWVKLCDLGLSRRIGDASGSTTVRGTPEFMAPETIGTPFTGDPAKADPMKADIWCLGETIARALTGRATFDIQSLLRYQRAEIDFPETNLRAANISQTAIWFLRVLMNAQSFARPGANLASQLSWISSRADLPSHWSKLPSNVSSYALSVDKSLASSFANPMPISQSTQASGQWTTTMPLRLDQSDPRLYDPGARERTRPRRTKPYAADSIMPVRDDIQPPEIEQPGNMMTSLSLDLIPKRSQPTMSRPRISSPDIETARTKPSVHTHSSENVYEPSKANNIIEAAESNYMSLKPVTSPVRTPEKPNYIYRNGRRVLVKNPYSEAGPRYYMEPDKGVVIRNPYLSKVDRQYIFDADKSGLSKNPFRSKVAPQYVYDADKGGLIKDPYYFGER